jgi:hypothetical protein
MAQRIDPPKDRAVMTISLISSIIIGIVLLVGAINGWRRGGIREEAALIGVLLGALLVEFWAVRWGQSFHEWSGLNPQHARWLVAIALLFGTAIFSGYGVGLLLPRVSLKSTGHFAGAMLGLLTITLLVAFGLRYTQQFWYGETDPTQPVQSWIREGIVSRYLLAWTDLALVGAAGLLALAAIVTAIMRLIRLVSQPRAAKPAPKPAAAPFKPPVTPAPTQPPVQPGFGAAPAQPKPAGQSEKVIDTQPRIQ